MVARVSGQTEGAPSRGGVAEGSELFIVDNSVSGWTGLEYLRQWCEISRGFDIATGFFEIGSLLDLDGHWQQLDKVRILMGEEVSLRTNQAFTKALAERLDRLDGSLENEKGKNPFLAGVDGIVKALRSGQIECRVFRKSKFHAKAYITHSKLDVVGARALVGSSNFTRPGLTQNTELNIQVQVGAEVAQLQYWFDAHWAAAEPVTEEVLKTITRHTAELTPFDVYAKALHEYFRGQELAAAEWDRNSSQVFDQLDQYQREAYWSLMKIARRHGGAFLCDGVGLGKTFVGLMLIERLVLHENKRVVLFAPKAAVEGVWQPHIDTWLDHIGGVGGSADFSNLSVFSHTDLSRAGDYPKRFERMAVLADAVVIDEAHHFRNRGRLGTYDGTRGADTRSRYWRMFDLINGAPDPTSGIRPPSPRPKQVFMLTATPINNRITDLRHMIELFTGGDDSWFARTLGVNNLTAHFRDLEREMEGRLSDTDADRPALFDMASEGIAEAGAGPVARELVVQRSRAYARHSQKALGASAAMFPRRDPPQVAEYSIRKSYGEVLDMFEEAFERDNPLFTLAIYYPLYFYNGDRTDIGPSEENRQRQVVGLIRSMFLKRFESSVYAFTKSLDLLMRKLLAFADKNVATERERHQLSDWKRVNADVIGFRPEQQLGFGSDFDDDESDSDDVVPPELAEAADLLDRSEYDVSAILAEVRRDLDRIASFLSRTKQFRPADDDKLRRLKELLTSDKVRGPRRSVERQVSQSSLLRNEPLGRKVLVFTEFADTARYVAKHLREAGIAGVEQLDGGSSRNRADVIRRFAPYYNGTSPEELQPGSEIAVLVSTDVLSEGLNLQDATLLVNYDIHWNPVRLMQRIGRVDRRMNPEIEKQIAADDPEEAERRGVVRYWNFLPPDDLDRILQLYGRVSGKTLLISRALGIEGRQLLTPEDDFDALKEFNAGYEGEITPVEQLHLEYQELLRSHPGLADQLDKLPGGAFSGRERASSRPAWKPRDPKLPSISSALGDDTDDGVRGVFLCVTLPALDTESSGGKFTLEAGPTRWYLWNADTDAIIEAGDDIGNMADCIRSTPQTPRRTCFEIDELVAVRKRVMSHIANDYERAAQVPTSAPRPRLDCWMELN